MASPRKAGPDHPYLQREEKWAVINGNDEIRILVNEADRAHKIVKRFSKEKIGSLPYRVARIIVFEDLSESEIT